MGGIYEASSLGRVRRKKPPRAGRLLSQSYASGGYLKVSVCVDGEERTVSCHSLVAEAFIGKRPVRYHVNHLDGVKTNNTPENLEYVTPAGNSAHAARSGLCPSGSRHGRYTKPERTARGERVNTAILDERKVRLARQMWDAGYTLPELMARFGMSKTGMHQVVTRKNWRHVT